MAYKRESVTLKEKYYELHNEEITKDYRELIMV